MYEPVKIVSTLEEVSHLCKSSLSCKSRALTSDKFAVLVSNSPESRAVWMENNVTQDNKLQKLDHLLQASGFYAELDQACREKKDQCNIIIKPNISIASQKLLYNYTDPELVNHVIEEMQKRNYKNIRVAESENLYALFEPRHQPDTVGKAIGYNIPIINLTKEPTIPIGYSNGMLQASAVFAAADFVVNFPKGRNHCEFYLTGASKNLFGAIPERNKISAFHSHESGFNVPQAITVSNHTVGADFIIMDMVRSIDGKDTHVSDEELTEFFDSGLLFAGRDPLALDKVVATKMGYNAEGLSTLKAMAEFRGNVAVQDVPIHNGNLDHVTSMSSGKAWRPVPIMTTIQWKTILSALHFSQKNLPDQTSTATKRIMKNVNLSLLP